MQLRVQSVLRAHKAPGLIPSTIREGAEANISRGTGNKYPLWPQLCGSQPVHVLCTHKPSRILPVITALSSKHGITYICRRKFRFAYEEMVLYHTEQKSFRMIFFILILRVWLFCLHVYKSTKVCNAPRGMAVGCQLGAGNQIWVLHKNNQCY